MKRTLFIIPLFYTVTALAQTQGAKIVRTESVTMKGAEAQKMFGDLKDKNIYDTKGNVVDSASADKMLRTFDYQMSFSKKTGQEEFRRVISKIDPVKQAVVDSSVKARLRPKSDKLQEGIILDLKPLARKMKDTKRLSGKALVLIFWCDGCFSGSTPDAYARINEVLSNYMDPEKLEILTITHHPFEAAFIGLNKNPIVNTEHVYDAAVVTEGYQTENKPTIVMTDKNHKILYAITWNAMITPRILNTLLKKSL